MASADLQLPLTVTAAADGTAEIVSGPSQTNLTWVVSQITVNATAADPSGAGCTAAVYLNQVLVCASSTGQQDIASQDPTVSVPAGSQLQIRWTGCQPGTQCSALLVGTQDYPG